MSKLDDLLEEHDDKIMFKSWQIKSDVKDLFLDMIPEPVGEDGIDNYDEPTKNILERLRYEVGQL